MFHVEQSPDSFGAFYFSYNFHKTIIQFSRRRSIIKTMKREVTTLKPTTAQRAGGQTNGKENCCTMDGRSRDFKEEFYFTTRRIPTLDDIKREIATIDGIEDVDEYANILYSYMD